MAYQALYRVFRPRVFEDVVGQEHITRTLQNAIMQNKFTHAYLFSGPRGTGKTSAAKIFAQAVNCQRGPALEPCNECEACKGILDGSISDVVEIDAASNNGVEQIRDIRDKVKYAPSAVTYKVYIIDEVHMLSIGAFNALLKTLEEPPQHVIFILATTEPHKIPLTIISRCQRFDFKRITQTDIVVRMQTIVDKENVEVDMDALQAVALAAEGGMRDALSILDQAISYSDGHVKLEDVLAVTGSVSQEELSKLVNHMHKKEMKEALSVIDSLIQEGKDPGRFVLDLIYYLRDLLLYQASPDMAQSLERAITDEAFQTLAKELDSEWIQHSIKEWNQCQQEIRWTNSPKVFLEITVLKISGSNQTASQQPSNAGYEKLMERLSTLEKALEQVSSQGNQVNSPAPAQQPSRRSSSNGPKTYKVPFERIRHVLSEATKPSLQTMKSRWPDFMDQLKQRSAPAHATVQNSQPRAASETTVIIAFRYEIHCSLALEHKETIELVMAEVIGQPMTFIPVPEEEWKSLREEYVSQQKQKDTISLEEKEEAPKGDPVVDEARKLFGDDVIEIHD
ncbi:DNA polymerase-3 subunit gamma/tau [Gracilibacillus halotolerans]|uniref:DNA-directed DNA polymerase n=1 Tax=Gracilibacillus halotolerans TaxID=74386 RepID=A0A841RPW3_9BACI|nr:DNA polymerase III subunit gamma/tau [Gracilibacillus halotolerans]MBB6513416.1 DNA polymerase-3 subunit gamma/tau [Gracilibacillus halotolerans]